MKVIDRLEDFPFIKRRSQYNGSGKGKSYSRFRGEIREDCGYRCVYCDAHELEIGGEEVFHLDHFRPRRYFPDLANDPGNLVWSCSRCNLLKRDDWPAVDLALIETVVNNSGYLDPFAVNRKEYFTVHNSGVLEALRPPGSYLVSRLALNRPFLRLNRRRRQLVLKVLYHLEKKEMEVSAKKVKVSQRLKEYAAEHEICAILCELRDAHDEALRIIASHRDAVLNLV